MGLSAHTFVCYGIAMGARLMCHLRFNGYLPYDKTGDFFLKGVEGSSFVICLSLVLFMCYLIFLVVAGFIYFQYKNTH